MEFPPGRPSLAFQVDVGEEQGRYLAPCRGLTNLHIKTLGNRDCLNNRGSIRRKLTGTTRIKAAF